MEKLTNDEPIKLIFDKYNDNTFINFKYETKFTNKNQTLIGLSQAKWFSQYDIIKLVYKYRLIWPDEEGIVKSFTKKSNIGLKSHENIEQNKLDEIIKQKNILYYKFFNIHSLCFWEINHKYDIVQKNYNYIYEINPSFNTTYSESIKLFYDKYHPTKHNVKINSIILDFLNVNTENKNLTNNFIKKKNNILQNVDLININTFNEYINYLEKIDKIDIIYLNFLPIISSIGTIAQYNIMYLFELYTFLKIINKINKNGSIYIYLCRIIGKKQLKLISFYCSFFEKYEIINLKITEPSDMWIFLVLKNKKEVIFDPNKMLNLLIKNTPMLGINTKLFNIETENNYLENNVPLIISKEYFASYNENIIDDVKINDTNIKSIYKKLSINLKEMLKHYHHNELKSYNVFEDLYNRKINGTLSEKEINEIKLKNIEMCKEWARRYNMPLVPEYNISHYDLSYENIIYREIVSFENDIIFRFKPYDNNNFDIKFTNDFENLPPSFEKMLGKAKEDKRAFDYRDINTYKNIKHKIDYYYKKLTYVLSFTYPVINDNVYNDEWLKITELLNKINLIDKTKTNLKSFHICEFFGSFVNAITFFLTIKTQNIAWLWKAQRLNPKNKQIYNDTFITNKFDTLDILDMGFDEIMINEYKNNYDFGSDNTGDITKFENIQYYRKNYNDNDLVTAGCGTQQNDNKYILSYSQYLMIFSCCKKGGNAILKKIFPIENSQELNMLYLFYYLFENVIIYKPKINYYSQEYFLIGLNYKGIDTKLLDKLIEFVKEYKKVGFLTNMPTNFILQVDKVQNELIENMNKFIKKQIYFCDNYETIKDDEWNILKKAIKEKVKDWFSDIGL
jgi:hypothetical protein